MVVPITIGECYHFEIAMGMELWIRVSCNEFKEKNKNGFLIRHGGSERQKPKLSKRNTEIFIAP
jgi:hypothetical protein